MKIFKNVTKLRIAKLFLVICVFYTLHFLYENAQVNCVQHSNPINPIFTNKNEMALDIIDVGQGEGIALFYDNHVVLVDTGTTLKPNRVKNYLKRKGVKKIDVLIITHPHIDHYGGLFQIAKSFKIDEIYQTKINDEVDKSFMERVHLVDYKNMIKRIRLNSPASLKFSKITDKKGNLRSFSVGKMKFEFLSPTKVYKKFNNNSIVTKVKFNNREILLTSDIEAQAEFDLLKSGADVDVDIYNVAHHGSKTSNTIMFMRKVSPKYAVLSCGTDNPFSHPVQRIVDYLRIKKVPLYRTDETGTIKVIIEGNDIYFKTSIGDYLSAHEISKMKNSHK